MHMFAFGLFPLFLYLIHLSLIRSNILFLFGAIISSFVFSSAVGNPALSISLWSMVLIYFFSLFLILGKQNGQRVKLVLYLGIAILGWIGVNLWWIAILGVQATSTYLISGSVFDNSLESLKAVSGQNTFSSIIRLYHNPHFQSDLYGEIYKNYFFVILSWLIPLISLGSVFFIKRHKEFTFFALLFIVSLFVCLGSNPPTGALFVNLFENIPQLQVFRNPYEKMGIVFLIAYAPFFGFGLLKIIQFLNSLKNKGLKILTIFLITFSYFGIYNFPLLTGEVISWGLKSRVPDEYTTLKQKLSEISGINTGNVLFIPLISDLGAHYKWKTGDYHGDDPLVHIFENPVITNTGKSQLLNAFKHNLGRFDYSEVLSAMRVQWIITRDDIVAPRRDYTQQHLLTSFYYPITNEVLIKVCSDPTFLNQKELSCIVPKIYEDFSNVHYLEIPLTLNQDSKIEVSLEDSSGISPRWLGEQYKVDKDQFEKILIPLINPTENPNTDFSKIRKIIIKLKPINSEKIEITNFNGISLLKGYPTEITTTKKVAQVAGFGIIENMKAPLSELTVISKVKQVDNFDEFFSLAEKNNFLETAIILQSQNKGKPFELPEFKLTDSQLVQKFSDTFYYLNSTQDSKYILLNKSFDTGWKLVNSPFKTKDKLNFAQKIQILGAPVLSENEHYWVNGYANLWVSKEGKEDQIIYYRPQLIMEVFLRISLATVCIITAISILIFFHKKI